MHDTRSVAIFASRGSPTKDPAAVAEPTNSQTIHWERGTVIWIQQTIDLTMCNTTCDIDDASLLSDEPEIMETAESASSSAAVVEEEEEEDEEELSLGVVGKMIQDLFHHDDVKVNAALDAVNLNVRKGKENVNAVTAWGGCAALVHLLKDRLKKAMKKVPACDQVSELKEFAELTSLHKTLRVITSLTYKGETGMVGIATIGGVEAAIKVMRTFPKCQTLQELACVTLLNLARCSIGELKAIESGGIEAVLAAVNNHLGSASLCQKACLALYNIVDGSKENTGLLISLGGAAAVAKVRTKWPDNNDVQARVRKLAKLIVAEMKTWADEE
jgi:hypothetical protein